MKVYGVQLDMIWEDKPANYARVESLLSTADIQPGGLIVLPEMFATGFSMNLQDINEPLDGPTAGFLSSLAKTYQSTVIGGVVGLDTDGKGLNQALIFNPSGERIARYIKMHPFTFGGETKHYNPGDAIVTLPCEEFTLAPFICYDLRFPEIFRHATALGANLLCVIACFPGAREAHWLSLLVARAIENQAYVIGVNRCGTDPKLSYSGRSLIVDPQGRVMADGGNDECVIAAELLLEPLQQYRTEFPVLDDMRSEYLPA